MDNGARGVIPVVSVIDLVISIAPVHRWEQRTTGTHYEFKQHLSPSSRVSGPIEIKTPWLSGEHSLQEVVPIVGEVDEFGGAMLRTEPCRRSIFSALAFSHRTVPSRVLPTLASHAMDEIGEGTKASAIP